MGDTALDVVNVKANDKARIIILSNNVRKRICDCGKLRRESGLEEYLGPRFHVSTSGSRHRGRTNLNRQLRFSVKSRPLIMRLDICALPH